MELEGLQAVKESSPLLPQLHQTFLNRSSFILNVVILQSYLSLPLKTEGVSEFFVLLC